MLCIIKMCSQQVCLKSSSVLTLALCDEILGDKGAYRVHGGGFAELYVQAFVP